jgi:hypothetical protein
LEHSSLRREGKVEGAASSGDELIELTSCIYDELRGVVVKVGFANLMGQEHSRDRNFSSPNGKAA